MTLLASHLEQISLSAKSIAELEYPRPQIFTNALLNDHEITTLIRDTEPHERALFSIDPNAVNGNRQQNAIWSTGTENGRKNVFPTAHPMKQSAITRLLGNELLQEIRQSSSDTSRPRDGVSVEVLLRGAEKLCNVYDVMGATEKIRALRNRYREVATSISMLEEKVAKQQILQERRNNGLDPEEEVDEIDVGNELNCNQDSVTFTEQDFRLEEDEIRELEARKKALEDRVSGMEKDLGGLLR
ncbi:uncharacterized protein Z518_10030 [Rhinocladiella mackenziei CBS 650.93]|uniref:DASH complex subunit SPC34 n=1 Tax=Rhinocladiella mackenziei CBS 650.93 TaxID=1442369 RepID=A0A0D2I577_9EURO|nr:uncharacterized protein Z518_10030 [Rhinocladiella mackenziei CBS 650.93]KIX00964.1 hypothetical protein Z518_10030 [Rhinocladiella mackenziei CBS 650.93]